MTAALDAATSNQVTVTGTLDDLSTMLTFDALWVEYRGVGGRLSEGEIANIKAFAASGRRVVMIGEAEEYNLWNNDILSVVGGTAVRGGYGGGTAVPVLVHPLTQAVLQVSLPFTGLVWDGTPLFSQNFATLWGNNILTVLDTSVFSTWHWNEYSNAQFARNVAQWVAAPMGTIGLSGDLTFGEVCVGTTKTRTFTITNSGVSNLDVSSIGYPAGFSGGWSGTVPPGGSQVVTVTFSPTELKAYAGAVAVFGNQNSGTNTIAVSGTGVAVPTRVISLSGNLDFGSTGIGTTASRVLTISNSGNTPLTVSGITYPAGFSGTWSGTVAPGGSESVTVTFAPVGVANYGGTITVGGDQTSGISTIAASGTGIPATRILSLVGDLGFGSVAVGDTVTRTVRITNEGNSPLAVWSIHYPTWLTAASWSGTLLPGGSHDVVVTFAPTLAGVYRSNVFVSADRTSGPNSLAASGNGTVAVPGWEWATMSSMKEGRDVHAAVVARGYVYVTGGYNNGVLRTVERAAINEDGTIGPWEASSPLTAGRAWHTAVATDDYVFVVGSRGDNSIERAALNADGTLGAWAVCGALPAGYTGAGAILVGQYLYVLGGYTNDAIALDTVWRARLGSDGTFSSWTQMSSMTAVHGEGVRAVAANGYLYAIGGGAADYYSVLSTVEKARIAEDGTLGPWEQTTATPVPAQYEGVVFLDGHIYLLAVASGAWRVEVGQDGSLGEWTPVPSLVGQHDAGGAIADGPYLYMTGGWTYEYSESQGGVERLDTRFGKQAASIVVENEAQTYDAKPRSVAATTTPTGLAVRLTYSGSQGTIYATTGTPPVDAGTYSVTAAISDAHYQGVVTETLTIRKAHATVTFDGLSAIYDGTQKAASAVTAPAGLAVRFTYDGTFNAPTSPGAYTVVATVADANYEGSATGTLVIATATRTVSLSGQLAFGTVTVGTTSLRTLTITNTGNTPLTVRSISYPPGFSGAWSGTIPPGGSQAVTVVLAPAAPTTYGGTVTVNGDQTSGTNTIAVSGTGHLPAPADFNSDGLPDLVWRNRVSGGIVFWLMDGTSIGSEVQVAGPQDRLWRIVGAADFNADGNPDLVMRHATTGEDQIWLMTGTTHSGTVALPTVADTRYQIVAAVDFNADAQPDLLWRNSANGDVVVWYLNGGTYAGWDLVASIKDPLWVMAGVADFNGDGKPDIVWHNATTGENLLWYMIGAAYAGWAVLPTEADTNWMIVGVSDYDGDRKPDLLWHNRATGANRIWRLGTGVDTNTAPPVLGTDTLPAMTDVDVEAIGAEAGRTRVALTDFNVDGHPDILWHNETTGESRIWYMAGTNGDTRLTDVSIGTETDLNWKIVAVADFNRDGLPDIVWRNGTTGANKIALMTGRNKTGEMALPTIPDGNWRIVGVGDFNQDGHPDLAWRNYATGDNIIWFLVNGEYFGWTAPPTITDTNWKIVAVGDFNGDGWPDLFWRNTATGENIAWFLVQGVYVGWGAPPTIPDPTWNIVGAADYNGDGKADLLWRNATTGENLIWYLIDGQYAGWAALPTLGIDWKTGAGQ